MDNTAVLAASGLRSRMEALDLLANNLANASTSGFKADVEMYGVYSADENFGGDRTSAAFPDLSGKWTNFSQGNLETTGNPTDLALSGPGFFALKSPSGNLYSREGNLRVGKDGTLCNKEGYAILNEKNLPIQLDPSSPFEIAKNGSIRQSGQTVGQISVVRFNSEAALEKAGTCYYKSNEATGAAVQSVDAEIHQGKLESSNVSPAESAIRLVSLMRQAEFLQRALTLSGEMGKKSTDEIGRVGS